jgi:hypothetical protein
MSSCEQSAEIVGLSGDTLQQSAEVVPVSEDTLSGDTGDTTLYDVFGDLGPFEEEEEPDQYAYWTDELMEEIYGRYIQFKPHMISYRK